MNQSSLNYHKIESQELNHPYSSSTQNSTQFLNNVSFSSFLNFFKKKNSDIKTNCNDITDCLIELQPSESSNKQINQFFENDSDLKPQNTDEIVRIHVSQNSNNHQAGISTNLNSNELPVFNTPNKNSKPDNIFSRYIKNIKNRPIIEKIAFFIRIISILILIYSLFIYIFSNKITTCNIIDKFWIIPFSFLLNLFLALYTFCFYYTNSTKRHLAMNCVLQLFGILFSGITAIDYLLIKYNIIPCIE